MPSLELRGEFKGRRLKGTAIELTNKNNTGATQVSAADFLKITYPTEDVLKTIEAAAPAQGRPVTLKGERGQGKSHLMAMLYHAFTDKRATSLWLAEWSKRLGNDKIASLQLRSDMQVISESLHRHRYKFLWDLLFDKHPNGAYCKGKWESAGDKKSDVPSDEILLEMFRHTPTALILDEFQTWYDGLTNTKQYPWRTWAFNCIQILSEISKEHPDLLVLVVSVRNGDTDAFQQIQRVNPIIVDFRGPSAKQDRLRLLLHRLFENRAQAANDEIANMLETHVSEYLRLKNIAPAEHRRTREEFIQAWPYAPHLMKLLEDQVLMATRAQETRDLIRILAALFKHSGGKTPIITAANFRLNDENSGIAALLDSVTNQHHAKLREKALRNLEAVSDAIANTNQNAPHLQSIIGALWLRSLAESNLAGADRETLHIDITHDKVIDDNAFQAELSTIVENSFNIHEDGNRYLFREEENPQAKLIASARNDKLFQEGQDLARLSLEVRHLIGGGADAASRFRVIVLPQYWISEPWGKVEESERPERWDERIPILIIPQTSRELEARLGEWLRANLQTRRNAVRFLLPRDGSDNLFGDRDLIILARAVFFAEAWKARNPEYGRLYTKYRKELREILKSRFDRYALISNWNFQEPKNCRFYIERHGAEASRIPDAIDKHIKENLFIPEDFEAFILLAAPNNEPVGKLMRELQEPRPGGQDCIPWLGETLLKEQIIRLCAKGKIAINLRGMEYLQRGGDETDDEAWKRMRGKLGTGKHLDETLVLLPQALPATGDVIQPGDEPAPRPAGIADPGGGKYGEEPAGDIFADDTVTPLNAAATSALNLLGKIETWGIGPATQLQALQLKVDRLSGAQLQELIKKLPDGMTYELDIEKEEM
ncbi:MAG: DUF499 domain-containing protein [Gammaproteobacteria bacterium]|nr:DUF499 domain-containing protein [Gammaproteobacteria bacterium]